MPAVTITSHALAARRQFPSARHGCFANALRRATTRFCCGVVFFCRSRWSGNQLATPARPGRNSTIAGGKVILLFSSSMLQMSWARVRQQTVMACSSLATMLSSSPTLVSLARYAADGRAGLLLVERSTLTPAIQHLVREYATVANLAPWRPGASEDL